MVYALLFDQTVIVICGLFLPMLLISEPLSVHWAQKPEDERLLSPIPNSRSTRTHLRVFKSKLNGVLSNLL